MSYCHDVTELVKAYKILTNKWFVVLLVLHGSEKVCVSWSGIEQADFKQNVQRKHNDA